MSAKRVPNLPGYAIVAWGTCTLLLLLSGGSAVAAPPTSSITFENDTRLSRTVDISEIGVSLDALLQKLSTKHLHLTCDRFCAGQKLQIRLSQRPLRTLLQSLAQLLPGTWHPRDDQSGYHLDMSYQAVSRRENWWHLFLGEQERAKAAQRVHVLKRMQGDPLRYLTDPALEERLGKEQEFFHDLSASLQERIANQMIDYVFINGRYRSNIDEGAIEVRLTDLPDNAQDIVADTFAEFMDRNRAKPQDVTVHFINAGWVVATALTLPNGKRTDSFQLSVDFGPEMQVLTLHHARLPELVRRLGNTAPPAWQQLATYQQSRVWPNDSPAVGHHYLPYPREADILDWLGNKANIEYVSDYYAHESRPLTPEEKQIPAPELLKPYLDNFAFEQDLSWKQRPDSIYLFRNNRWYRDDYLEVPMPLLRQWLDRFESSSQASHKNSLTLDKATPESMKAHMDWAAEVVSTLTPWQIANGLQFYALDRPASTSPIKDAPAVIFPFVLMTDCILREFNTAGFYVGLSESSRKALTENRLPLSLLSSAQQEQAAFILPAIREVGDKQTVLLGLQPMAVPLIFSSSEPTTGALASGPGLHLILITSPPSGAN